MKITTGSCWVDFARKREKKERKKNSCWLQAQCIVLCSAETSATLSSLTSPTTKLTAAAEVDIAVLGCCISQQQQDVFMFPQQRFHHLLKSYNSFSSSFRSVSALAGQLHSPSSWHVLTRLSNHAKKTANWWREMHISRVSIFWACAQLEFFF